MFRGKPKIIDPLDQPVMRWSEHDAFTVRDLMANLLMLGRSGSGKTSSSGLQLLRAIVRMPKSGGLILGAKPEDKAMVQSIFKTAGRELDVFEADGKLRLNFLDYEMSKGAHTRNIVQCIMAMGETLRAGDSNGGRDQFWDQQKERFFYNAIEVVRLATGKITAPDLQAFFSGAANVVAEQNDEKWRAGFHNRCLAAADQRKKTAIEQHDLHLAMDFWLNEYPRMADKTRTSIMASVMGVLHTYNTGLTREMVSGATNITPDVTLEGGWIFVNFPRCIWGDIGSFISSGMKYLVQRAVLRRQAEPGDCFNVIWSDEAAELVNSFDSSYLAQCRSHLGGMVYLAQSKHSFYSVLKGQSGRSEADALLTNFGTKICHALGDIETAQWVSGLIGKSLQQFYGGSMAPVEDPFDELMGQSRFTSNFSSHWEDVLHPNVFLNGLRTGGKANGLVADAIVIKSGEPFANGSNWLRVAFSQK